MVVQDLRADRTVKAPGWDAVGLDPAVAAACARSPGGRNMGSGRFEGDRKDAWVGMLHVHAQTMHQLGQELDDAGKIPLSTYDILVQLTENGGLLRIAWCGCESLIQRINPGGIPLPTAGFIVRIIVVVPTAAPVVVAGIAQIIAFG